MKFAQVRNMGIGETRLNKRRTDIIGNNLTDPFFDSYEQETFVLCDMLDRVNLLDGDTVNLFINKNFLKKIIHSHIVHTRQLERDSKPKVYAH